MFLKVEFEELAESIRNVFTIYINWFKFFTTINLVGYGWFAGQLAENKHVAKWIVLIVCIYFVFQHCVALLGSREISAYFVRSRERMAVLLPELDRGGDSEVRAQVPCPLDLYIKVVKLIASTFPSMMILWIAFAVFAFVS